MLRLLTFFAILLMSNVGFISGESALPEGGQLPEKPMIIITASYNNQEYYKRNLDSIFAQEYTNYQLIHWDDASTDGSGDLVAAYIKECGQEHRCTVMKNRERRGACANEYFAAHQCYDEDAILVIVDGDDAFARPDALKIVNEVYQDPQIWLTYGQNEYTCGGIGQARELPWDCYVRHYSWVTTHLRTSYARLFKKIKLEDFFYDSSFLSASCDLAQMFPMLDMAGNNTRFIPTVLYLYNVQTPLNDHVINAEHQTNMEHYLRARPAYARIESLDELPISRSYSRLVINPDEQGDIKECIEQLEESGNRYVWITENTNDCSPDPCMIDVMESTGAYAFYDTSLVLEKSERIFNQWVKNQAVVAWQYRAHQRNEHQQVNALYRTNELLIFLKEQTDTILWQALKRWIEKDISSDTILLSWGNPEIQVVDQLL